MILHVYMARRFAWSFIGVSAAIAAVLLLLQMIEEADNLSGLTAAQAAGMVMLELPGRIRETLPLLVLLAGISTFLGMSRSSELAAARAAGRSAVGILAAPAIVAAAIGFAGAAILGPISAASSKLHSDLVGARMGTAPADVAIAPGQGLWLRQGDALGQTVIHAESVGADVGSLHDVTFLEFTPGGLPRRRVSASSAELVPGAWIASGAKVWNLAGSANPEAGAREAERLRVPTDLTHERILGGFGRPEFISPWKMPEFIRQLEQAGFSALRYSAWFHRELAQPLFLIALVVLAAALTMRPARLSSAGLSSLAAVLIGFGMHYLRNLAQILGETGGMPVWLSAWAPPATALLVAAGLLLHLEDG